MIKVENTSATFLNSIAKLGFFDSDDALFLTNENEQFSAPEIQFHLEKAYKEFHASAVYFRKQLNGSFKPQIYLYDYTGNGFIEKTTLTEIQKEIWSSGEVPLACVFYDTEIKIINCTTHINENNTPAIIYNSIVATSRAKNLYDNEFAVKIKSGVFWEEEENKNRFDFKNSSYDKLIENIRIVVARLKTQYKELPVVLINKIIIQSILIKYLEERIDHNGGKLLSDKFFIKYDSNTFNEVLRNGKFLELLEDLNDPITGFNGNVFEWSEDQKLDLHELNLSVLADLLDTKSSLTTYQTELFPDWRYFEFKYIPVELISRLYEEFLASADDPKLTPEEKKKKEGTFYTPSHLVKLLVDEALPLKKYNDIDLDNFQILDPSCGSGIFLVIAFKRLVQIWRLKHEMAYPTKDDLKRILRNLYGIDKEKQAVQLASFSLCLALCNELEPLDIIQNLKFDDLRETNIIHSDFFIKHSLSERKFNLIIGNPPFVRGGTKGYTEDISLIENSKISIPSNQLALKFLIDSYSYLKPSGLQCLVIKSSSLLYNTTSNNLKEQIFSKLNVIQVLDFTALARNKSLWDGADVAAAAIFIKNEKIDFTKNILHLTFRRTKATKERIVFEIDDYDLHFISRQTAIENQFIWKNNLLGGGRIKTTLEKFKKTDRFEVFLEKNNCVAGEGWILGTEGDKLPKYLHDIPTIPTRAIRENGIDYSLLTPIDKNWKFVKVSEEIIFISPNIILWENIGIKRLPVFYNETSFSFKDKIIGIGSKNKDNSLLKSIVKSFDVNSSIYRFYIFTTSSQVLINLNSAILKEDYMSIPFLTENNKIEFSDIDKNIIDDVNEIMQLFLRNGENSKAVKPIPLTKTIFEPFLENYGNEFSKILNVNYEGNAKKFRLSDVIKLKNSFIATIFKYDDIIEPVEFHDDIINLEQGIIEELSNHRISQHLSVNRIIKIYPQKDTIILIKPNQYRYWSSMIAYRDADKSFADYYKAGY